MRETKYKAWDKENAEMRYLDWELIRFDKDGERWSIYENGHLSPDRILNHQTGVLMQYTGLKDQNGKEIYEGDIVVKYQEYEDLKEEGLENDLTQYTDYIVIEDKVGTCGCGSYVYGWNFGNIDPHEEYGLKVIGNKFEHPHLLEQCQQ